MRRPRSFSRSSLDARIRFSLRRGAPRQEPLAGRVAACIGNRRPQDLRAQYQSRLLRRSTFVAALVLCVLGGLAVGLEWVASEGSGVDPEGREPGLVYQLYSDSSRSGRPREADLLSAWFVGEGTR